MSVSGENYKRSLGISCIFEKTPLALLIIGLCTCPVRAAVFSVSTEAELRQAILDANASIDASSTIVLSGNIVVASSAAFATATKPIIIDTNGLSLSAITATGSSAGFGLTFSGPLTIVGQVNGGDAASNSNALGGKGVTFTSGSLLNNGAITGGRGGNTLNGGSAGRNAGKGGVGLEALSGSSVVNSATGVITGGAGGVFDANASGSNTSARGGDGATGVTISGGTTLDNQGLIVGGAGGSVIDLPSSSSPGADNKFGGKAGVGANITGGTHSNSGTIRAGVAGNGSNAGSTGHGISAEGVILAGGAFLLNTGRIDGGDGKDGGSTNFATEGSFGAVGIRITSSTLENRGTITGGDGGGTNSSSIRGERAIVGVDAKIINSGTINAGLHTNGVRTDAIQFTGGVNSLELQAGSNIDSQVIAFGSGDTLILGGSANASLSANEIGSTAKYRNFGIYKKTGSSTWTLTGTTATATPWQLLDGTLSVSAEGGLGAVSSALTINGGTLQITGSGFTSTARTINWGALGGGFDIVDAGTTFSLSQNLAAGGALNKLGAGKLSLSGTNNYSAGTNILAGTLIATHGNALGAGTVNNASTLQLDFATDSTLTNVLSGSGDLLKSGAAVATITSTGSSQGNVQVQDGILRFAQNGAFSAGNYTTNTGAITQIAAGSSLSVASDFIQTAGSTLSIQYGGLQPLITASNAILGGTFNVSGIPTAASVVPSTLINVIHTTAGAITGDFSTVSLGSATSPVDYITLTTFKSTFDFDVEYRLTWLAGSTLGNGLFTLVQPSDIFNVDLALTDQSPSSTSWDGKTLTKAGDGTLLLSAVNTYSGSTLINAGILQTDVSNAFANSSAVNVASGATLDLNNFNQTVNNLSGAGLVSLGTATLIANNDLASSFSGIISGSGGLIKTGTASLTLSGSNTYSGETGITAGTLVVNQASALSSGMVSNSGTLQLDFALNNSLLNVLAGTGSLLKTGAGVATLSAAGSSQGSVQVQGGTLNFTQSGAFNASDFTTATGATTQIAANSTLNVGGAFVQASGSTLNIALGSAQPIITANSASLGGSLTLTGISAIVPSTATALATTQTTVIHTTGGGISNAFSSLSLGGASSPVDYITLDGRINNQDYQVGYGLTWLAGLSLGNGLFTLGGSELFNVDLVLEDQSPSSTSWDGKTLTKLGAGTLLLSAANTYSGSTLVNVGTLQAGIANAFANSSAVSVASGATLDLNSFNQTANNLSGVGAINLGSATLTANNNLASAFSGIISGSGGLTKTGSASLTLSGGNTYSGGTNITNGTLVATQGGVLGTGAVNNSGTLQLDFAAAGILSNNLTGTGTLLKTGAGVATLSGTGSTQGDVLVQDGTLLLLANGLATSGSYTTATGATTQLVAGSSLHVATAFTQSADSTLNLTVGGVQPIISANTAELGGLLRVNVSNVRADVLIGNQFNIIHTTAGLGSNDFSSVILGATSPLDYLVIKTEKSSDNLDFNAGFSLTWYAGVAGVNGVLGNGVFTLTEPTDSFDLDVILTDQAATAAPWDGKTLTKLGAGSLRLSAVNTYSGSTLVNAGTLQAGIANAFVNSSAVSVASGATLDLNNFDQTTNNLSGAGTVSLGSANLTANNNLASTFSGVLTGSGSLNKTGTSSLTLSGNSTYSGGTSISGGALVVTQGSALGTGTVDNLGTLHLDFSADSSLSNVLTGTGTLLKTGAATATLSSVGSSQGDVSVQQGVLNFSQLGAFNSATYSAALGATTQIAADATLNVTGLFSQAADSNLNITLGSTQPIITAGTANLSGNLNIAGFGASIPNTATGLTGTLFKIIQTSGGISNDFTSKSVGGSSPLDYITLTAGKSVSGLDYEVGFGLTWLAGQTLGNGVFTLTNASDSFDLDVGLSDQAPSSTNWDGKTLTKAGAGTLLLSAVNSYSGTTLLQGGYLRATVDNVIQSSSGLDVQVGNFNLEGTAQEIRGLSGSASVSLRGGQLTLNNLAADISHFSGVIDDGQSSSFMTALTGGRLVKAGDGQLILTGENQYLGDTEIQAGVLQVGDGGSSGSLASSALLNNGTLIFKRSGSISYAATFSGQGQLIKQGSGLLTLTGSNFTQGSVDVQSGALNLAQSGPFKVLGDYITKTGAISRVGEKSSSLVVDGNFTQQSGSWLIMQLLGSYSDIRAGTANLGGRLTVTGFTFRATPNLASQITGEDYPMIRTTGGITGDFSSVNGVADSGMDYLITTGRKSANNLDFVLGFRMAWTEGGQARGTGNFTVVDGTSFTLDEALADQAIPAGGFSSGWDGRSLTKRGTGYLELAAANSYSGLTSLEEGYTQAKVNNVIQRSSGLQVLGSGNFDLLGTAQEVQSLSGDGSVSLGGGQLTVNSAAGTTSTFSGAIDDGQRSLVRAAAAGGSLIKAGQGTLTLSGATEYQGITYLNAGTLVFDGVNGGARHVGNVVGQRGSTLSLIRGASLTGWIDPTNVQIDSSSTWNLTADSRIDDMRLAGTVAFSAIQPLVAGRTLTARNWEGQGGILKLYSVLSNNASVTDKLVIDGGQVTGTTQLQIANVDGLGAQTSGNGIEVISAVNGATTTAQTSRDGFVLAGEHVDAGAFEYRLYAGDELGLGENWYLRSGLGTSSYRDEVVHLTAVPAQLRQADLAMLGNFHRRVGDDSQQGATALDRRAWVRTIYSDMDVQQGGTINTHSEGNLHGLQVGIDLFSSPEWRSGFYLGQLQGDINVRGASNKFGENRLRSRYFGGYATWAREDGLYLDSLLQWGEHSYEIRPNLSPNEKGDASSLMASVELGKPFALSEHWSVEPQIQLAYQKTYLDDLSLSGAKVKQEGDDGLIGRVGLRLKGDSMTSLGALQTYLRGNLYYAESGTDLAQFSTATASADVRSNTGYTSAELAGGLTLQLNTDTSVYAEVGKMFDVSGDAEVSSSLQGTVGLRWRWE